MTAAKAVAKKKAVVAAPKGAAALARARTGALRKMPNLDCTSSRIGLSGRDRLTGGDRVRGKK